MSGWRNLGPATSNHAMVGFLRTDRPGIRQVWGKLSQTNVAESTPTCLCSRAELCSMCPNFGRIGPKSTKLDRIGPNSAKVPMDSANLLLVARHAGAAVFMPAAAARHRELDRDTHPCEFHYSEISGRRVRVRMVGRSMQFLRGSAKLAGALSSLPVVGPIELARSFV